LKDKDGKNKIVSDLMSPKTKFIYDEFNDSKGNILSSLPSLFALGQNPTNQSLCLPSGIGGFS
jgi:hypothetical protein